MSVILYWNKVFFESNTKNISHFSRVDQDHGCHNIVWGHSIAPWTLDCMAFPLAHAWRLENYGALHRDRGRWPGTSEPSHEAMHEDELAPGAAGGLTGFPFRFSMFFAARRLSVPLVSLTNKNVALCYSDRSSRLWWEEHCIFGGLWFINYWIISMEIF